MCGVAPNLLADHAVAHADVGLDILGVAGVHLQLLRRVAMKTRREGVSEKAELPQISVEDKIVGEDLPGISGQKAEQLVLDGGEMDLHPISIGTAGSIVDLQVPVLVEAGFLTYLLAVIADPAQGDPEPGQELVHGERFSQIVIGAASSAATLSLSSLRAEMTMDGRLLQVRTF